MWRSLNRLSVWIDYLEFGVHDELGPQQGGRGGAGHLQKAKALDFPPGACVEILGNDVKDAILFSLTLSARGLRRGGMLLLVDPFGECGDLMSISAGMQSSQVLVLDIADGRDMLEAIRQLLEVGSIEYLLVPPSAIGRRRWDRLPAGSIASQSGKSDRTHGWLKKFRGRSLGQLHNEVCGHEFYVASNEQSLDLGPNEMDRVLVGLGWLARRSGARLLIPGRERFGRYGQAAGLCQIRLRLERKHMQADLELRMEHNAYLPRSVGKHFTL